MFLLFYVEHVSAQKRSIVSGYLSYEYLKVETSASLVREQ